MNKSKEILDFIHRRNWLKDTTSCSFLAAGEYNENYLVSCQESNYVFRINHGTQLFLDNQIEYEFQVLEAISGSGVTPLPYKYSMEAEGFGKGVLLMEYIEGRPLDYKKDIEIAAKIFARIHSLAPDSRLIQQKNPIVDICRESYELLHRYPREFYPLVYKRLTCFHDELHQYGGGDESLFTDEPLCIVNTEVNSGNFLINPLRSCLVDWEKAVVSFRYQDLAHFLIATTTLWKTNCRLGQEQKNHFLSCYNDALQLGLPLNELLERTKLVEKVILLRALSWCFMAYHEYRSDARALSHDFTLRKITSYLDEVECFFE